MQCRRRVSLGLHRLEARTCVLLGLKVLLSASDRCIGGIQVRRVTLRGARSASRHDGLTRIAHFLDGGGGTAE